VPSPAPEIRSSYVAVTNVLPQQFSIARLAAAINVLNTVSSRGGWVSACRARATLIKSATMYSRMRNEALGIRL
jgi:hypothetical protein